MKEKDKSCLQSEYMEANPDIYANYDLAKENALKILDKAMEHERAVLELQKAHAAGEIDSARLRFEVRRRDKIIKKLNQAHVIFGQRCDELRRVRLAKEANSES